MLQGSLSVRDPSRVMGRVSFSVRAGSVRTPRSPWQGRRHVCYRVPPRPGALHAVSGLVGARAPGEAAAGAVATSPSRVPRFPAEPAPRTRDLCEHCAAARQAPDVSAPQPAFQLRASRVSIPLAARTRARFPGAEPGPGAHCPFGALRTHNRCCSQRAGNSRAPSANFDSGANQPGHPGMPASEGRRFRAARGLAAPIVSWKGTAPPLARERKGREEHRGWSSLA